MDNRQETEQEMRVRLKAELKAELMAELQEEQEAKEEKTVVLKHTSETIKPRYNNDGVREATELLNRDKTFVKKEDGPKSFSLPQADDSNGNLNIGLVVVVLALIIAGVYFIPGAVAKLIEKEPEKPVIEEPDVPVVPLETITLNSESVKKLVYPIMRNNPYTSKTYFTKTSFTVGDLSNNDLLYNAFLDVYEGNIGPYMGGYSSDACVDSDKSKVLNASYIDARIENRFTKSVEYEHKTFKVPSTNLDTAYVGTWKYDSKNHQYIYYGNCTPLTATNTRYYDLQVAYDAKGLEKNTVIEVYYHIGIAKVDVSTKTYYIYSDANMTQQVLTGELTTKDYAKELQEIFEKFIKEGQEAGKYKYIFSSSDCSYQSYCFESGEWVAGV